MADVKALDKFFKFKLGEIVQCMGGFHKLENKDFPGDWSIKRCKLQIVERSIQNCPGGYQIHYSVRHHMVDSFGTKYIQFNEIELEPWSDDVLKSKKKKKVK